MLISLEVLETAGDVVRVFMETLTHIHMVNYQLCHEPRDDLE